MSSERRETSVRMDWQAIIILMCNGRTGFAEEEEDEPIDFTSLSHYPCSVKYVNTLQLTN